MVFVSRLGFEAEEACLNSLLHSLVEALLYFFGIKVEFEIGL